MLSLSEKIKAFYASHGKLIKVLLYLVWAVLFAFLAYTVWKSRDQLLPYLAKADYSQLIIVVAVYMVALFLAVLNWVVIMHAFESSISLWMHAKIYLVSMVSRRLPGTIWYVGGRMVLYKKLGVPSVKTASASGIEFIISFVADALLAAFFIPLGLNLSKFWLIPLVLVAVLGLLVLRPKTIKKIMTKLKHPLAHPVRMSQVIGWLILRMALVLTGGVMIFFAIRIFSPLGINSLLFVLGARALSGAAGMLTFLLPSSMGASDLTLLAMLSTIIPTSLATVIALLVRIYTTLFELLFGLTFFIPLNKSYTFTKILSTTAESQSEPTTEEDAEESREESLDI
ncbi:MAG: lysylphosphatidylglycerol synthase domain-containing protein [Anaerolineaceae bacterium]